MQAMVSSVMGDILPEVAPEEENQGTCFVAVFIIMLLCIRARAVKLKLHKADGNFAVPTREEILSELERSDFSGGEIVERLKSIMDDACEVRGFRPSRTSNTIVDFF